MFTILENYKILMRMCLSIWFEGAPSVDRVDANVDGFVDQMDLWQLSPQERAVVKGIIENTYNAETFAMIESGQTRISTESIKQFLGQRRQVSEVAHTQEAWVAQDYFTTLGNATTVALPQSYETVLQQPVVAIEPYAENAFQAPVVETINGQVPIQLNQAGLPADGSQLVEWKYYQWVAGEVSLFSWGCFTIQQWFITHAPSNAPAAKMYAEQCPPGVCGIQAAPAPAPKLEVRTPAPKLEVRTPAPAPVFEPYVPYKHKSPTPNPPKRFEVNCNGEKVPGEHVVRQSPYDVYLAEWKIFRVNQVSWLVEERTFGLNESRPVTPEDIRRNIHMVMQNWNIEANLLLFKVNLGKMWETVGYNENVCTPVYESDGGSDNGDTSTGWGGWWASTSAWEGAASGSGWAWGTADGWQWAGWWSEAGGNPGGF